MKHLFIFLTAIFGLALKLTTSTKLLSFPSAIKQADSKTFHDIIRTETPTFALFYHPGCPHCRAVHPHFVNLSSLYPIPLQGANQTQTLQLIAVDASDKNNGDLISTYSAMGFPTLKLFKGGKEMTEYGGARDLKHMKEYLVRALKQMNMPEVTHCTTMEQLRRFISDARDVPVVISVSNPAENIDTETNYDPSDEIERTRALMRSETAVSTAFATVSSMDFFASVPTYKASRRFHVDDPVIAASTTGAKFFTNATWHYIDVRDGEDVCAFMHVATVPENGFVTLTEKNAGCILETDRTVVYVFGGEKHANWEDDNFLRGVGETADTVDVRHVLPVFVPVQEKGMAEIAEHVTVNSTDVVEKRKSVYAIYRAGNGGRVVKKYDIRGGKSSTEWLEESLQTLGSRVQAIAGEVFEISDSKSWNVMREFDGRGVLVELYKSGCPGCKRFKGTYAEVARMMKMFVGDVVVARYDVRNGSLPEGIVKEKVRFVPTIIYVPPVGDGVVYGGVMSARGIVRFARDMAEVGGVNGVDWYDVVYGWMFVIGVVMVLVGMGMARRRRAKVEHVT